MKHRLFLLIIFFAQAAMLTGCLYEYMMPPDICGIYKGTRTLKYFPGEVVILDIQEVNEKGISGTMSYVSDTSLYSVSFEGEWRESDSSVDIHFTEKTVLARINYTVAPLCSYRASISSGFLDGTYTISNRTYDFSARRQTSEAIETYDSSTDSDIVEE